MKAILWSLVILLSICPHNESFANATGATSARLNGLDAYWREAARTVREGDFEGYKATYHPDAVLGAQRKWQYVGVVTYSTIN